MIQLYSVTEIPYEYVVCKGLAFWPRLSIVCSHKAVIPLHLYWPVGYVFYVCWDFYSDKVAIGFFSYFPLQNKSS